MRSHGGAYRKDGKRCRSSDRTSGRNAEERKQRSQERCGKHYNARIQRDAGKLCVARNLDVAVAEDRGQDGVPRDARQRVQSQSEW